MVDAVFGLNFLLRQEAVGIVGGCRRSAGGCVDLRHNRPLSVYSPWGLIDQKIGIVGRQRPAKAGITLSFCSSQEGVRLQTSLSGFPLADHHNGPETIA